MKCKLLILFTNFELNKFPHPEFLQTHRKSNNRFHTTDSFNNNFSQKTFFKTKIFKKPLKNRELKKSKLLTQPQ